MEKDGHIKNHSTMIEQPQLPQQQQQDPSSSEPLLKQAVNAAFPKECVHFIAMGPMGIGWGLGNSWACVVYWILQFFALLFLAVAMTVKAETDSDAHERTLAIAGIVAVEIILLAGRIFWKKKRHDQEASFTHCVSHTLLEIVIASCIFLGMVLIDSLQICLIGKSADVITTKSWIFYYLVAVVSHMGVFFSVSHSWAGARELQNMRCIGVLPFLAIVVNAVCMVRLGHSIVTLLAWSFAWKWSTLLLLPLNYLVFVGSLISTASINMMSSGSATFDGTAPTVREVQSVF